MATVQVGWLNGSGTIPIRNLTADDRKYLYAGYLRSDPVIYPTLLSGLRNDIMILLLSPMNLRDFNPNAYQGQMKDLVDAYVTAFVQPTE